jgi:eukaryotic-like serine/threonine-protein kinase
MSATSDSEVGRCRHCGEPLAGNRCISIACATRMLGVQPDVNEHLPIPLPPPSLEEIEEALPEFSILGPAGIGASGRVVQAQDKGNDRIVAIKVLRIAEEEQELTDRFNLECRLLARLSHKHITKFFGGGRIKEIHYGVMEWKPDGNLEQLLATSHDRRLRLEIIMRVMGQLCDALAYAHGEEIIHRDVKPSNLLLDGGNISLADFGLAKRAYVRYGLTKFGVSLGTPGFMAPEQSKGRMVDYRSDVYSVGAVLYRLLTQLDPIGYTHPPSHYNNPEEFDLVVSKAMETDPDDRYDDIISLRRAMDEAWSAVQTRREWQSHAN